MDNSSLYNPVDIGKAKIVERYQSGTSIYRVWSDGIIEQWGKKAISTNGSVSITFPKEFTTTNIVVTTTTRSTSSEAPQRREVSVNSNPTTTGFSYYGVSNSPSFFWYAIGK